MRRIKKGYILLFLIAIAIYYYFHYKSEKTKEYLSSAVKEIITDIRHQDYFKMQDYLIKNYSVEEIKEFCSKFDFSRDIKFNLKDYEKKDNKISLDGVLKDNKKTLSLKIKFLENNSTLKVEFLEINKSKIESKKYGFPIVLDSNKTKS